MNALTAAEMREVDRLTTERFGVPGLHLMENAGKGVAEEFLEHYGRKHTTPPRRVCILCGKGNNGGDGLVVARYLKEEVDALDVFLLAKPEELNRDAAKQLARWREAGGAVTVIASESDWASRWPSIATAEVLVDALLGTGIRGAASGVMGRAIEDINRLSRNATAARPGWIVAVDTPSGLPSDGEAAAGPVLRAHLTVSFTAPKVGQLTSPDADACGHLAVRAIGSPDALIEELGKGNLRWAGPEEFAGFPFQRRADSNKGLYGHALIVAGSVGKSGASILAGNAALRAGAGLVTIATPAGALQTVAAAHPEYMTEPLPATPDGTLALDGWRGGRLPELLKRKSALAIGPGIGTSPETQELVRELVRNAELPIVLDADGLNAFAGKGDALAERKSPHLVITPHPGEMARLLGTTIPEVQKDRVLCATESARRWNAHVLLKGFHTVLASPRGGVLVNTTGTPALAKGGSGDVLTGVIAALIGQFGTNDLLRVAALGAYLHGSAAELLSAQTDESGILAGEVARVIPYARRKLLEELQARG